MSRETKLSFFRVIVAFINLILALINLKFSSVFLKGLVNGINFVIIGECIFLFILYYIEDKKDKKRVKEKFKEITSKKFGFREDFDWETRFNLKTQVGDYEVSTVDLGIDHNLGIGKSLYYETMIFSDNKDNPFDGYQERYATEKEARKGHKKAIAYVEQKLKEIKE